MLLDKMCKYGMDPANIVEDTEGTPLCPQTDRRTEGQGETSIPSFQFVEAGGITKSMPFPIIPQSFAPQDIIAMVLRRKNGSLLSIRKDFGYMCHGYATKLS